MLFIFLLIFLLAVNNIAIADDDNSSSNAFVHHAVFQQLANPLFHVFQIPSLYAILASNTRLPFPKHLVIPESSNLPESKGVEAVDEGGDDSSAAAVLQWPTENLIQINSDSIASFSPVKLSQRELRNESAAFNPRPEKENNFAEEVAKNELFEVSTKRRRFLRPSTADQTNKQLVAEEREILTGVEGASEGFEDNANLEAAIYLVDAPPAVALNGNDDENDKAASPADNSNNRNSDIPISRLLDATPTIIDNVQQQEAFLPLDEKESQNVEAPTTTTGNDTQILKVNSTILVRTNSSPPRYFLVPVVAVIRVTNSSNIRANNTLDSDTTTWRNVVDSLLLGPANSSIRVTEEKDDPSISGVISRVVSIIRSPVLRSSHPLNSNNNNVNNGPLAFLFPPLGLLNAMEINAEDALISHFFSKFGVFFYLSQEFEQRTRLWNSLLHLFYRFAPPFMNPHDERGTDLLSSSASSGLSTMNATLISINLPSDFNSRTSSGVYIPQMDPILPDKRVPPSR